MAIYSRAAMTVQIAEWDMADHREDVLAQAALDLGGGTIALDVLDVAFR